MPTSDAFVVGDDFLSEHYFTTDATKESFHGLVLDRRKAWDAATHDTSRSRFTARRGELATALAALYADPAIEQGRRAATPIAVTDAHARLREVLGYASREFATTASGPVTWFNTAGVTADPPFALIEAEPAAALEDLFTKEPHHRLLTDWHVDDRTTETSVTKAISRLFNADDGVQFVLVLAGRWALVTEAARWAEGRYLAVDLQTVCDRNEVKRGGEIDRALTILDADSLAPDADGQVWWSTVLEASVKHTVGVSKDLREGVRRSIEIIANEVVARRRAQGLEPLPAEQAQPLARQSLRFLYRILFLLYAEASPELGVLPVGATEYDTGYSLDRLRELTLVELASPKARTGTHFYDSLAVLFRLIDRGHPSLAEVRASTPAEVRASASLEAPDTSDSLVFHPLRADLFKPDAIALIAETKLGNGALQEVLEKLLVSREQKGRERGFISYVDLGINQLGAVYEGLMSYTGFFAEEDLYEVARAGNPEKGSWVVPVDRAQGIAEGDFVRREDPLTGEKRPVVHERGQFVFRLSGRARQQSASYYTPEVLTKFTVGQALEELLDQDDRTTTAEEILSLSVCEPALGSGAFAIEAVRQLAEQYLTRRQKELGETVPPEEYQAELQKVKAYLALHNVYGVDLNATAVEFAEITLWLDTMAKDLAAPWFGLHLRRGNSLIGARRSLYSRGDVTSKAWLTQPATDIPLTDLAARIDDEDAGRVGAKNERRVETTLGRIHHFLLPAAGWGATADSKEAKELAPDRVAKVKEWRKQFKAKPTAKQLDVLVDIAAQAEELWTMALRRLMVADAESRRDIPLWGRTSAEPVEATSDRTSGSQVTREQIEASLADPNGAYRRLKLVMDAWCALWFWPLTGDTVTPPSWADWIEACQEILGAQPKLRHDKKRWATDQTLAPTDLWESLAEQEAFALTGANAKPIAEVVGRHGWLRVCQQVADDQGFFHWPLEFAPIFGRGGFDLQVGNPPWVQARLEIDDLLSEWDPWHSLASKPSQGERNRHRASVLSAPGAADFISSSTAEQVAIGRYLGDETNYPALSGDTPELYRCFIRQSWRHASQVHAIALIHPVLHLSGAEGAAFRTECYERSRRLWHFINELKLFEIQHQKQYSINIYSTPRCAIDFQMGSWMYTPEMALRSMRHDGGGTEPGRRTAGTWDTRPHLRRVVRINDGALSAWSAFHQFAGPSRATPAVFAVNQSVDRFHDRRSDTFPSSGSPRMVPRNSREECCGSQHPRGSLGADSTLAGGTAPRFPCRYQSTLL